MSKYEKFDSVAEKQFNKCSLDTYLENTLSVDLKIKSAYKLHSTEDVVSFVKLASKMGIRINPISSGNNWGYGSASGCDSDHVVLDLSEMKNITFNTSTNSVTLGPGVTQQNLYEYFEKNDINFLVPTTGAGPDVSIVGNLLERGYGITPVEDHFESLLSLEVVLADGKIYKPTLEMVTGAVPWGWDIGPYLQGLFTQSSLGAVTSATIRVVEKTENIGIFRVESHVVEDLVTLAVSLRKNALIAGINVMNAERINSMLGDHPKVNKWTLLGSFYCDKVLTSPLKRIIKKQSASLGLKVKVVDYRLFTRLDPFIKLLFPSQHYFASQFFNILSGTPTDAALKLVSEDTKKIDSKGLIWYSPAFHAKRKDVKLIAESITEICRSHGISPLITFTLVNEIFFDATIPILFDKSVNSIDAWKCYDELVDKNLKTFGIFPYRLPVNRMNLIKKSTSSEIYQKIKDCLDPNGVFSDTRYLP